jgi:hypothetical protein
MKLNVLGFSGSKTDRVMGCVGCVVLPATNSVIEDVAENPAARGIAVHAFLCDCAVLGRERALAQVRAEFQEQCAAIDTDQLPTLQEGAYAGEVALAYDVKTGKGRVIGFDIGRDYGQLGPWEIGVTIDSLGLADEDVVVWDYKTGWTDPPAPGFNWQLTVGALAARAVYKKHGAHVGLIRLPAFRTPWSRRAYLDSFTLDERADQLHQRARFVAKSKRLHAKGKAIELVTGVHCNYCPALPRCPAQTQLVHAVALDPAALELDDAALTTTSASAAWDRMVQIRKVLDVVEGQIRTFAAGSPVPLSNGKVLGIESRNTESLDGLGVYQVMTDLYGEELAKSAVDLGATKTSVERALRAHIVENPHLKLGKLVEGTLDALRKAGAVRLKSAVSVTIHHASR